METFLQESTEKSTNGCIHSKEGTHQDNVYNLIKMEIYGRFSLRTIYGCFGTSSSRKLNIMRFLQHGFE